MSAGQDEQPVREAVSGIRVCAEVLSLQRDEAQFPAASYGLRPCRNAKLSEYAGKVRLHRTLAQAELQRDFFIARAGSKRVQHADLPLSERLDDVSLPGHLPDPSTSLPATTGCRSDSLREAARTASARSFDDTSLSTYPAIRRRAPAEEWLIGSFPSSRGRLDEEICRRMKAVRTGTARSRDFEQVFADLDRRFPT